MDASERGGVGRSFGRWAGAIAGALVCLASACTQAQPAMGNRVTEPYHVGVWYFTLWNSSSDSMQVKQGEKLYGRTDAWSGVRDFAQGHGAFPTSAPPGAFADREPLIGYYDLMSQSVVDTQIEEAASEGIDFFAFYWYFDPNTGAESTVSAPTSKFFGSRVRGRMKFLLAPISMNPSVKISLATWRGVILPKLIDYMASDAYFRLNGRPVLVDFSIPMATAQDKATAYADLRAAAQRRFGANPILLYLAGPDYTPALTQYVENAAHPDGFTCFGFSISRPGEPYGDMTNRWIPDMEHQILPTNGGPATTSLYIPCGSIGQDPRPWYGIGWNGYGGKTGPESRPYTVGTSPATFGRHLEQLKSFMDSGEVDTMHTVILYAWNEWGEAAAMVEPSRLSGYAYADEIRRVFGLFPRGPRPVAAPNRGEDQSSRFEDKARGR